MTDVSHYERSLIMVKSPETRKEELLAAANELFHKNGVDATSVSDIVHKANVAQGTFYNYFKSKDEIFAEVLKQASKNIIEEMKKLAKREDINPIEKLNLLFQRDFEMNRKDDPLFNILHEDRYAAAHQKYIVSRINSLKPIYTEVIKQGTKEGYFNTVYPEEAALFMLTSVKFLFDPAFFTYGLEGMLNMSKAAEDFCERILGARYNSFAQNSMEQHILDYFGGDKNESGF